MSVEKEMIPCVIVADPEIGMDGIMSQNMVCFGQGGGRFQVSPNYLHLLAQRHYSADFDPSSLQRTMDDVDREERDLRLRGLGEVVDAIGSNRVRLSILLDTSGGVLGYRSYLEMIQWYLGRTGGVFMAYGGERVHSLGALLLSMPHKGDRFAHPFSKICFHLPQGNSHPSVLKRESQETVNEDIVELETLLMGLVGPGEKLRMESVIREGGETSDHRVEFYGRFAEELGILETLGAKGMRDHFLRQNGLPEVAISGTPVALFFDRLAAYESETREAVRGIMRGMR